MMMQDESKQQLRGFRPLQGVMTRVTKPALGKLGKVEGMLLMHWRDAVGKEMAACTRLRNISEDRHKQQRTLHVEVLSEKAQLVEYQLHEMVESIAVFMGYKAIHTIMLHQVTEFVDG